ncbi:hypothetical protein BKA66DRAFT_179722 [Pyrenochaeta sp. MPI-SDFR-AT-0127]|nr:hypothetical protein BKA66DRAFT_179722 [Pyrenochaeta sp. MPI-SDFR-AT-0127]
MARVWLLDGCRRARQDATPRGRRFACAIRGRRPLQHHRLHATHAHGRLAANHAPPTIPQCAGEPAPALPTRLISCSGPQRYTLLLPPPLSPTLHNLDFDERRSGCCEKKTPVDDCPSVRPSVCLSCRPEPGFIPHKLP